MSSSNSNLPVIILVVIAILVLGGFYYADRSAPTTDIAAITDQADTESMIKSKKKYEADKSAYSHSGYSGSAKEYLDKYGDGTPMPAKDVKQHSGYSGSADEYMAKHGGNEVAKLEENANNHSGFSGSMEDYASGNYDTRKQPKASSSSSKPMKKSASSGSHSGYTGSVDDYLNKYK